MMRFLVTMCALLAVAAAGCRSHEAVVERLRPPATRVEPVTDDYHGRTVADPYRWLEDQDSEEVLAWARAQNLHTEAFLAQSTARPELRARLRELYDYPRMELPRQYGDVWIYERNDGLQDQDVVFVAGSLDGPGRVLFDPNRLSDDGSVSLSRIDVAPSGEHVAFGLSRSGSDWLEWRIVEVATGAELEDSLQWTKFTSAAWTHDGEGFFYLRYPEPPPDAVYEEANKNPRLCYHRIGTAQADDAVVYERPDEPEWAFGMTVTDDGRYGVVSIWQGTDRRNRVAFVDLADEERKVRPLRMEFDARYSFIGNEDRVFYFWTDESAPHGRVIAFDVDRPEREHWTEVVPERDQKLQWVDHYGGELVAHYLDDASSALRRFGLDGAPRGGVELPGIGSVSGSWGKPDRSEFLFVFEGFTQPATVYAFDLATGERRAVTRPEVAFDPDDFVTRRVAFEGEDGTRLAMFLVHAKGLRLDRGNPTYLYGYGGFNISITPRFSESTIAWVERGGLYAQATLRGGGEYGESWHEAGMLKNKQNVFDDFAACARYLIRNDYTQPEHLAIGGRSNGGLLVGATLNQHPELFGAAIPEVGVLDMLRYHTFTIGWAWASEYGRSDDPEMFDTLFAYSPIHNVRDDVRYPPTMIMTGDHDDRVLPGHSYKFAATLQAAQPDAIALLRVQMSTGHGAGKPVSVLIDEAADRWAFLWQTIGR